MKKVLGLFLVILVCSVSMHAQKGKKDGRMGDPSKRMEQMITDLKMNDTQAADFRKIHQDFMEKMRKERDEIQKDMQTDRTKMREKMEKMREDRNAEIKKILTEDQYNQYLEKQKQQQARSPRKGNGRR